MAIDVSSLVIVGCGPRRLGMHRLNHGYLLGAGNLARVELPNPGNLPRAERAEIEHPLEISMDASDVNKAIDWLVVNENRYETLGLKTIYLNALGSFKFLQGTVGNKPEMALAWDLVAIRTKEQGKTVKMNVFEKHLLLAMLNHAKGRPGVSETISDSIGAVEANLITAWTNGQCYLASTDELAVFQALSPAIFEVLAMPGSKSIGLHKRANGALRKVVRFLEARIAAEQRATTPSHRPKKSGQSSVPSPQRPKPTHLTISVSNGRNPRRELTVPWRLGRALARYFPPQLGEAISRGEDTVQLDRDALTRGQPKWNRPDFEDLFERLAETGLSEVVPVQQIAETLGLRGEPKPYSQLAEIVCNWEPDQARVIEYPPAISTTEMPADDRTGQRHLFDPLQQWLLVDRLQKAKQTELLGCLASAWSKGNIFKVNPAQIVRLRDVGNTAPDLAPDLRLNKLAGSTLKMIRPGGGFRSRC